MGTNPDDSEVADFESTVAELLSIKEQLDVSYHRDQYSRERLLATFYIKNISEDLRDRVPRTAQKPIPRVINCLSDDRKTAGSVVADWATGKYGAYNIEHNYQGSNSDMYSLEKSFCGQSERKIKFS